MTSKTSRGSSLAMTNATRIIRASFFAALVFVMSVCTTFAQDPMKVAPSIFRVLLENTRVRVLQEWLPPGEKEPMHSHPRAVRYALNSFKGKSTSLSGKVTKFSAKAGQVDWSEPETHAVENTGRTTIRAIILELKTPQYVLPRERGGGADPLRVASHSHKLLFENKFVRVLLFHLIPGQRTKPHYHPDHVSYVLSGGILRETLPNRRVIRRVWRSRQAKWVEGGTRTVQNIGTSEVRLLTVELKSPLGGEK
jgi:quercetin dioxygenase-like cupin family protein